MIKLKVADHKDQEFSTIISGKRVTIRLWLSERTDRWSMDLSIDKVAVLTGRKIVSGIDLLEPYNLGIGVMFAWGSKRDPASGSDLSENTVSIYSATREEIDAAVAS